MRKVIFSSKKIISRRYVREGFTRPAAYALLLMLITAFSTPYRAQPVPVPQLDRPAFNSNDMQPIFDLAGRSTTETVWEWIVSQGRAVLTAQWEAYVDAQIAAELSSVNNQDYFQTDAEYKDYLLRELLVQKQSVRNQWEIDAELAIQAERDPFLAALAVQRGRELEEDSDREINRGEAAANDENATVDAELARQMAVWEQEFIANMERGIYEYDTALGQLAMDHQSLLDQIAQREAEFEQDRLRIEAYETDVRNGISDTLVSMRAYLQSNGLFHAENCDPNTNVCTTDMTRFNAAGDDLNTMINAIQDKLDNDAPLSVIAQMMYDYLDAQEQAAVANQSMWQNRIEGDINWSSAPHPVHLNSGRGGQCAYNSGSVPMHYDIHNEACRQNLVDWAAINANEPISAYLDVVQGRGQDRMKDYLKRTAGLIGDVTRIDSIDLCGQGQGVSGVGGGGGLGVNRLCYSNRGNEAFVKSNVSDRSRVRLGIRTGPRFWTDSYAEHDFDLKVNFHWYDPQAETNAVRWQGYVDDIRPVLGHWRDNLLPAITTWEAQTDAFDADLDAFKTEAAQQRADAVADFETSRDHLISERTRWIEAMRLQYREGTRDWAAFQQKLERTSAENANATNESFSYANAPTVTSIPTTAASTLAQYRTAATNRDLSFLDKESSAPDYSLVSNLGNEFRNLGLGLKQLTLATAIHNQINDEREQIINQQIAMITGVDGVTVDSNGTQEQLDGYQVTVLDNGTIRATRQIHSGRAVRTGGDGTSADHYRTELTEQMIEIAPPPTVAMPDTGSMFAEWDTRSVMQEYGTNRQETFEQMTDYMQGSQDRLMDSMKAAALNQKRFYEDRSSQIAAAIAYKNSKKGGLGGFLKSVAMAMFTGGVDLNTAVSQQANQMFTNEIAEAFGIPSGIVSGVLTSGLPVHEAFNDWVETDLRDEMISEAAKATGWPETIVGAFADGADMQDAWQDYTQEMVNTEIAKRVDDPALQQMLMQTLQGMRDRLEKKEARMDAGRFRAEDYATGGFTMAMRYADAEGMDFSDSSIPQLKILGTMQNTYGMLRDGADQKAVLAEMVEGSFNAGYGVAGMEVDLEYSDRGGFSGSASISVPLGMGPQLAGVSAQEGRGVTHSETISGADFAREFGSKSVFDGFKGLVTDTMGDLMSIPSGLIKHWQGDADLHKQLEQSLAAKMEEEAYKAFEASSGIPATIIKGMADKQPLDTVWKDYTDELIMDELANQANCDDKSGIDLQACQKLAAGLQEKFQQWKKERAKKEAQKWRPEDAAGGLTYVWRNAQHDEDLGFAVTVAETAGGYIANTAGNVLLPPAGGTLIYAGYMATKQAYMGALNARKEDRGKAALAGLASGGLNALLDMTKAGEMLDVNLSYNSRDGFGASVDVGYKLSENVKVGMALDFNEGAGGFDGGRLSAGYQPQSGFGVNGAINFDRNGNYQGASLGGGYREGGFNGGLSMNFNQEHRFTGGSLTGSYGEGKHNVSGNLAFDDMGEMNSVSVDYTYDAGKQQGSGENQRYETWYKPGGGLTFNRDGSFALRAKNTIGVNDRYRHGLSGAEGWMQNQLNFGADGQYAGIDYDFGAEAITQNDKDVVANLNADILRNREALPPAILAEYDLMQARIRAELGTVGDHTEGQIQADLEMKWNARVEAMLASGEIDAETADTMRALNMAERTYQTGTQEATFVRYVDRLLHEDRITPGDAAAILDDPSKLHDYNLGSDAPYTEQSRQGLWNKAVGFVQDQWDTLMGGFSSDYGYIDPVSGEFVGRTCFVAGTKVRVHPDTAGALLIDNAYYKDIETIQVGDRVLSWNEDSAEVTYKPVTQTFIRETTLIYQVAYADGTELQTTWNHPFYIENKGWVEGKDLRVDDHSLTETVFASAAAQHMNANSGTVVAQDKQYKAYNNATATDTRRGLRIVEITKEWRDETVYNFEVADNHTYFVGNGNVLVHNENYSLHSFLTKPAIVTITTRTGTQFKDATGIGESGTLPVGVNIEILSTDPVMVDGELMIPIRTDSGRMGYIPFNEGGPVSSYPSPGSTGNVDTGESGNSPQPELDLNNSQNTDTINNGSNDSDVPTNPTEQLDNCDVNGKVNGQCNPTKPGGLHYDIEVPSWSNLFGFFSGDSADNRTELANSSSTATTEGAEFEANMAYGRGAASSTTIESREVNLEPEAGGWGASIGNFFESAGNWFSGDGWRQDYRDKNGELLPGEDVGFLGSWGQRATNLILHGNFAKDYENTLTNSGFDPTLSDAGRLEITDNLGKLSSSLSFVESSDGKLIKVMHGDREEQYPRGFELVNRVFDAEGYNIYFAGPDAYQQPGAKGIQVANNRTIGPTLTGSMKERIGYTAQDYKKVDTSVVIWDPAGNQSSDQVYSGPSGQSVRPLLENFEMALAHELIHIDRHQRGVYVGSGPKVDVLHYDRNGRVGIVKIDKEEALTVGDGLDVVNGSLNLGPDDITENMLRAERGLPLRNTYNKVDKQYEPGEIQWLPGRPIEFNQISEPISDQSVNRGAAGPLSIMGSSEVQLDPMPFSGIGNSCSGKNCQVQLPITTHMNNGKPPDGFMSWFNKIESFFDPDDFQEAMEDLKDPDENIRRTAIEYLNRAELTDYERAELAIYAHHSGMGPAMSQAQYTEMMGSLKERAYVEFRLSGRDGVQAISPFEKELFREDFGKLADSLEIRPGSISDCGAGAAACVGKDKIIYDVDIAHESYAVLDREIMAIDAEIEKSELAKKANPSGSQIYDRQITDLNNKKKYISANIDVLAFRQRSRIVGHEVFHVNQWDKRNIEDRAVFENERLIDALCGQCTEQQRRKYEYDRRYEQPAPRNLRQLLGDPFYSGQYGRENLREVQKYFSQKGIDIEPLTPGAVWETGAMNVALDDPDIKSIIEKDYITLDQLAEQYGRIYQTKSLDRYLALPSPPRGVKPFYDTTNPFHAGGYVPMPW